MFAGCIWFRECLLQYQLQFHDSDLGMLSGFTICKPIVWSTWSTCTLPHVNPHHCHSRIFSGNCTSSRRSPRPAAASLSAEFLPRSSASSGAWLGQGHSLVGSCPGEPKIVRTSATQSDRSGQGLGFIMFFSWSCDIVWISKNRNPEIFVFCSISHGCSKMQWLVGHGHCFPSWKIWLSLPWAGSYYGTPKLQSLSTLFRHYALMSLMVLSRENIFRKFGLLLVNFPMEQARIFHVLRRQAPPEMAPDRQRNVRMQSYQALLQQSATAKPGAALPDWRPKRETEKVETVKAMGKNWWNKFLKWLERNVFFFGCFWWKCWGIIGYNYFPAINIPTYPNIQCINVRGNPQCLGNTSFLLWVEIQSLANRRRSRQRWNHRRCRKVRRQLKTWDAEAANVRGGFTTVDGRIPAPPGMVESLSIIMVKPPISGAGFRSHPPYVWTIQLND